LVKAADGPSDLEVRKQRRRKRQQRTRQRWRAMTARVVMARAIPSGHSFLMARQGLSGCSGWKEKSMVLCAQSARSSVSEWRRGSHESSS
jgi:hypothetical protein